MASTIRIKRRTSGAAGSPAVLKNAELAMNEVDSTLYYGVGSDGNGDATSIIALAGPGAFATLTTSQTLSGNKTFSGTVNISGTLQLGGTSVSASAAEINKLAGVTAGTASAGKVLVVDSNKDLDLDGGDLTVQNLTVDGDLTVQGTVTTVNSTTVTIQDKAIELAVVNSPTDTTADQGGFIVKGATDKSFLYDNSSTSFKSSENLNLVSGKVIKINGTEVLSSSSLGSGVTDSSLTSVGIVSAGTWEGDTIAIAHGGTGETTAQDAINTLTDVASASAGQVLTKVGSDAVWATPTDTGITSLNGLTVDTQTFEVGTSGSDFNISSSGSAHTFNIPDASMSARGLVTTGFQEFNGSKVFTYIQTPEVTGKNNENLTLSSTYPGAAGAKIVLSNAELSSTISFHTKDSLYNDRQVARITGTGVIEGLNGVVASAATSSSKPLIAKGAASQSANLFEAQNSSGTVLFAVSSSGAVTTGSWTGTAIAVANGGTGATTEAGARENLGLEIGVDVQAQSARLQAIADLNASFSAGIVKVVGYSASSTAEYVDTTEFSRSLLDDADASSARTTLGLVIGTNVQAYDPELAAIAGLVSAADKLPYFTGSGTAALADFSSFGRSLVDDADASAARTTLGLGSMATQAANNVSITGGSIDGVAIDGGSY